MNATYKGVFIGLGIALLGFGGYKSYEYYQAQQVEEVKLKPLTNEEIFNKNQDAVVLIKHSFVYILEIMGEKFYFRDYNPDTGVISDFISYEEAKENPNETWGTGFFVKEDGSVLTNRHVVRVHPSREDQEKIKMAIKAKLFLMYNALSMKKSQYEEALADRHSYRENIDYYSYEYDEVSQEIENLRNNLTDIYNEMRQFNMMLEQFDEKSRVSKTSFQFGVFMNNQVANGKLDNYIQYKSVKISEKEDVDLALLHPVNTFDISNKKIVVANMSKVDSVVVNPPKITQKVVMIGYNYGDKLANTTSGIKPQITEGSISQNTDAYKMLYTIPALPGSSGSPIFDTYGRVIAVNFAGVRNTQSFNFGIQTQQVKIFLEDQKK